MRSVDPRTKMRSQRYTVREDAALERGAKRARQTVADFIRSAVAERIAGQATSRG
jgi:hypothetical protein